MIIDLSNCQEAWHDGQSAYATLEGAIRWLSEYGNSTEELDRFEYNCLHAGREVVRLTDGPISFAFGEFAKYLAEHDPELAKKLNII